MLSTWITEISRKNYRIQTSNSNFWKSKSKRITTFWLNRSSRMCLFMTTCSKTTRAQLSTSRRARIGPSRTSSQWSSRPGLGPIICFQVKQRITEEVSSEYNLDDSIDEIQFSRKKIRKIPAMKGFKSVKVRDSKGESEFRSNMNYRSILSMQTPKKWGECDQTDWTRTLKSSFNRSAAESPPNQNQFLATAEVPKSIHRRSEEKRTTCNFHCKKIF